MMKVQLSIVITDQIKSYFYLMKKAIVIGATSGIGKSLSEILIQNGFVVGVTGRRVEMLAALKEKNPDKISYRQMDVQDVSSIETICNNLVDQIGGLDLIIISAGIGDENKSLDFTIENNVIKTNIQGFTCVANWAMNHFKKQGHGHLVNISSIAGLIGNGEAPSYNATKAYQINYLEGLRLNADKLGSKINVTDVRPGFVNTDMAKGEGLFWVSPVEKAAQQIFTAIKKKKKVVYITKRWRIIGFLLKIIPYSILRKL
jgi:short-subunit dehydrogenase